ncbi:MFS transporter [Rhizobium cauense]|uniref:MFS transporter n=1 Tax=Rhizobium cauense TaxID=1166683 RepID=UPI001CB78248|nr:MFS transporter [Rhizobium cauense]
MTVIAQPDTVHLGDEPMSSGMTFRILMSSLVGTSVEFYDFYIYATAASLVFGPLFFPATVSSMELIGAYASFGIAFIARPVGGAVFGHFGDRVGRKATLVVSLLLMGASTAAIGLLPTYAIAGWLAPALLCLLRFGQGLALGGEWTGAALLAVENAPKGWRARYAMFAPLGAPIGFLLANSLFLVLTLTLSPEQFSDWGWRVPFLLSAPLVWMGIWIRFNLVETRDFHAAISKAKPSRVPLLDIFRLHMDQVMFGAFGVVACFSLYYVVTAFALGYGTSELGYTRSSFLMVELGAILFMAAGIIVASWLSDRIDPERILIFGCVGTIISGIVLAPMLGSGSLFVIFIYLAFSLWVMGFVNGPLGAWLPGLFPTRVRYSGTSVAFNIGGIIGGALTPVVSQALSQYSGLVAVGFYLAITGGLSLIAFDASARRKALDALAQSDIRYRSIFEQNHVSLCEVDLSFLWKRLEPIRAFPPSELRAYLDANPAVVDECAKLIRFVDVNGATVQLFGKNSDREVLGSIDRFLPAHSELAEAIILGICSGGDRVEMEARLLRGEGAEVIVIFVIAFPEDKDTFDRVACAMIDVTQREQAKEALIAAQAELARVGRVATVGAISASIAHEVNQPIGAVVMSAQACVRWLKSNPPDIKAASTAAERAITHSMRASEIIQRTREQVRGARRTLETVDLRDIVTDVVGLLDRELISASTRVTTHFEIHESIVLADRVEIQQVIANLVTNGLQAMGGVSADHRELGILLSAAEPSLIRLQVRDHGTGIAQENLSKLFSPFFTTKSDGMGIGLAICKTIVEAHGGSLTARNHDDGGAIFEILLPLSVEEENLPLVAATVA